MSSSSWTAVRVARGNGSRRESSEGSSAWGFSSRSHAPSQGQKKDSNVQAIYGIDKYVPEAEREPTITLDTQRKTRRDLGNAEKAIVRAAMIVTGACGLMGIVFPHLSPVCAFAIAAYNLCAWLRIKHIWRVNTPPSVPVYDIEGLRHYPHVFMDGEHVSITEKIHGCNARFVHTGDRLFIGSRTQFKMDEANVWARIAKEYSLETILAKHPNMVLFGEVYGAVQDLRYGHQDDVRFVAFDVMDLKTREYLHVKEFEAFCDRYTLPRVPVLYEGPWYPDLAKLAEGKTTMPCADHVREGIVVKPMIERHQAGLGRVFLKLPGEGYLLRKGQQ